MARARHSSTCAFQLLEKGQREEELRTDFLLSKEFTITYTIYIHYVDVPGYMAKLAAEESGKCSHISKQKRMNFMGN